MANNCAQVNNSTIVVSSRRVEIKAVCGLLIIISFLFQGIGGASQFYKSLRPGGENVYARVASSGQSKPRTGVVYVVHLFYEYFHLQIQHHLYIQAVTRLRILLRTDFHQ